MRDQAALDLHQRLKREGEAAGYYLNPDVEFVLDLMEGLLINEERYGYQACPCRLADGARDLDRDIICPCDYRDPDLDQFGACYCALYVSEEIAQGKLVAEPVPERRGSEPSVPGDEHGEHEEELVGFTPTGIPVWRCKVCGYLCARNTPPLKCPICKADRDRFQRFA
ncbi:MAG TPA: ferredoxin-thioredoxin reductase catalytic domain-containing protein [Anaerolineae bacterium]|nr:ferredoxin-thioredoxin reductase catalytic domain-containing protein [Anaerolineae bacterium]